MKLSEYLVLRGSRALTNAEAKAIGVKLKKGWVRRYADFEVPEQIVQAVEAFKEYASRGDKKRLLKRAARRAKKLRKQQRSIRPQPIQIPKVPSPVVTNFVCSDAFLDSFEWRKARYQALVRHGARCQCCGRTAKDGIVINVDHIKPRRTHPELALDVDNLQVLCGDCNHGKGNWDSTDWRPKTELDEAFKNAMHEAD